MRSRFLSSFLDSAALRRSAPRRYAMLSTATQMKASTPTYYKVPTAWKYDTPSMKPVHEFNFPTSGSHTEKDLSKGKHDIQLYGFATLNGMKVSIMLEELNDLKGIEYDAWFIKIGVGDQFTRGFVGVNQNSKIPAILDQSNNTWVFESGTILAYLAEKYDAFLPQDPVQKAECLSWVFFQGNAGPYNGGEGLSHLHNSTPMMWEYAIDRNTKKTKRIMDVMDKHLEGKDYFVGNNFSIADIMHYGWNKRLVERDHLESSSYQNLMAWVERISSRPAVQRGARVLSWGDDGLKERHSKADFHIK